MKVLMRRLFMTIMISLAVAEVANAQMLALKTNALNYAAFAPNIGAELVTSGKTSVSLEAVGAFHSFGTNLKAFGLIPEVRYWFHGRPMTREFIGLSVMGGTYNMRNNHKTFKGNVGGFGVTFGYSWRLGHKERWTMEAHAGLGFARYNQHVRYAPEFNEGEWMDKHFKEHGWVFMPYKLGLSFSYILPTEKVLKNL